MDQIVVEVYDSVTHGFVPEQEFVSWLGCLLWLSSWVGRKEGFKGRSGKSFDWVVAGWNGVVSGKQKHFLGYEYSMVCRLGRLH